MSLKSLVISISFIFSTESLISHSLLCFLFFLHLLPSSVLISPPQPFLPFLFLLHVSFTFSYYRVAFPSLSCVSSVTLSYPTFPFLLPSFLYSLPYSMPPSTLHTLLPFLPSLASRLLPTPSFATPSADQETKHGRQALSHEIVNVRRLIHPYLRVSFSGRSA